MKTYQFTYKSKEGLSQTFTRISSDRKRTDAEGIFFYITWTHNAQDLLGDVTKLIQYHFPGSVYYGAEASGNIADGSLSLGIHITCFIFEEPDSRVELVWVEEGGTPGSLDDLWDICRKRDGLRAVELIPSSTYLEKLNIDNNVPGLPGDIVIFGGTSICYNDPAITAGVMAAGLETVLQGMIAILYYGSELHISSAYVLGWKGLGRYMRVTGCEGKIIHAIDGHPAFSIYEKYLNLTLEDNDALVFPLIVEEDGVEFIRTPQAFLPDRSIQTLTAIPEDAHVRIAYGDRNAILSGISEKLPDIAAFAPQVLKVYSCAVRRFFWGDDDISQETVPLQQIAPVCGFYTGGELLRLGSKLRVLNSTLVLISLREGAADTSSVSLTGDEKRTDKSLVSRLSFFTEQIAKEQTIQYAHEKLRGDVADYLANHDEDPMELLRTFAEPMRQLFKADQMVFHGLDGSSVISGSPLAENIWSSPDVYCKDCPYSDPHCPVYTDGVADIGNCRSENCGLRAHPECPVRSEFNQIVLCNNEPVGSVSVRYITQIHEFSTLERETLIELNRVLSLAMSRYKASQENLAYLKQKEEERRQKEAGMNSTLDSLSDNYDLVLFVNQSQDLVVRVKGTDEFTSVIDALPSGLSGIKKLYEFFRIIVFPEDYDDFIKYTSSERVDRYAAMGKSCSYNFRVMRDGKTEYFRIRITRSKEMSDCCVITLLNINDDYLLREKLENDEKRLEYLAVIENFSQDYDSISYIRLGEGPELDRPITYRISEKLAAIIPGWTGEMNYRERMTLLMEHFVIKEDRAIFNLKVQREVIMEALRRSGIYFVNFRAYNGKDEQYYQLKYTPVYDSNGEMRAAISGLHNIDDEMRRELQRNDEITAIVEERTASLKKANAVLSNISDSVLEIMAGLVESRSAESGTHIRRVKGFTLILAEQIMNTCPEYGLTKDRVENITQASALHDIGKIAIPDSVLLKPGKLTPEERDIMMTHSARGAEIIEKMSSIWDSDYINTARDISLYHHEKWDGGGYPCGLKGDDIPIAAQIVSIADIYDALTNERCYKRAFTPEEAYNMIVAGECGKFSARMMACFKACRAAFEAYAINPVEPDDRRDTKTVDLQFRMPEHIRDRIFISDKLSLISSIAEHLPNGFFAYRDQGDGELILFNDVLVRMFGCESREEFSEYIGSTFRGIVHPDDYDRTQKTIYSQIASNLHDMDHVIYRITRKDGEVRTIDDYGHLVHSLDLGDVFFVCLSDISGYSTIGDEYDVGKILDKMRILLVDDDELSRDICRELLELEGASVTEAESGPDALRIIGSTHPFDMILTDVIMPGMDGVEFIRKLRESYPEVNTTVIACSADDSESMMARCMDAGADSFVKKPLNISDLSQKMISCMKRKFDSMGRQLKSTIDLINTDPLTGCQNITAYTLKVGELDYAIKKDTQEEFAVLVCDINDLKQENNDNGHNSGDLCIRNCCDILCKIFSRSAVYRIGGDEFTVILEGDECAERSVLMRRLYLAVEKSMHLPSAADGKASFAAGIAVYDPESDESLAAVMSRAGESMIRNKTFMKEMR